MITAEEDDWTLRAGGFEATAALLDLLLWSGPTSMIPTREAVMKWRATLIARGPEFASLVTEHDEWLTPDEGAQG